MSDRRKATAPASPLSFIGTAISYVALCLAAMAALALVVVPMVSGSQTYSVLTSSMAPKYAPGTFLVVKPTPFDELGVGDIITYQIESGSAAVITHRITSIRAEQTGETVFITKGDNNALEDPLPVREVQVKGKLFYAVPFVGFIANGLGNSDRGAMAQWGAVALMGYGLVALVRGALAKKRKDEDAAQQDPAQLDPAWQGPARQCLEDHAEHVFPSFNSAPGSAFGHLCHDDLILTDCDGCDHVHEHNATHLRAPSRRATDRDHANV